MPTVRRHPDFETDFLAQLDWLVSRGDAAWIPILASGLDDVVRLLEAFPAAGAPAGRRDRFTLRKIFFPRGPYVAWYVHDPKDPAAAVWLLRLFHARQRQPIPKRLKGLSGKRRPRRD